MVASKHIIKWNVPESSVLLKTLNKATKYFLKPSTNVKKIDEGQDTYNCL